MKKQRLGEVLVQQGTLTEEELNRAVAIQQEKEIRLGELLLQSGKVSKSAIVAAMEQVQGVPYADCPPPAISPEVLALLPHFIALRCCALPLECQGKELVVAMAEPQNLLLRDELRFSTGMSISPRFSFREDILAGIKKHYGRDEPGGDSGAKTSEKEDAAAIEFITTNEREENREALKELQAGMGQQTSAVRYVSRILAAALKKGASDVHIEPRVGNCMVRLRVDGILSELLTIPSEHQAAAISRIKILADMDIAERRVPQDGRFLIQYRDLRLDLRVSTLPTHFGEKIVMRLLDPRSTIVSLGQLGLSPQNSEALNRILALPQGTLIITGPTGSGKSTTLYAALNLLSAPHRNIITVEDPVEYMLEGVNQVQIHPKAGLTFPNCLRSILRQDPDVIMVGEIRDGETAEIALKAAQTGHLVLSTLHTNDSISAISRLHDLGVPSYLISSSVTAVMAQRLVRKLCSCRKVAPTTAAYRERLAAIGADDSHSQRYEPAGCASCDNTGYKGRVGIYELLLIDGPIRDAIYMEARAGEICSLARAAGFRTTQEDALEKVKEGVTTLEEVLRVVPFHAVKVAQCSSCSREVMPGFPNCPFCGAERSWAVPAGYQAEIDRENIERLIHAV